ncbi:MAG: hypothetical protein PHD51_02710 [Patescibacteria group bacterium]|nr:hypothetical protein [Patescibacteria group bacterium]MDD5490231.1 hypothetical protein [Patescibacteria group bacterium]
MYVLSGKKIDWKAPEKYLYGDTPLDEVAGDIPLILSVPHDGHLTEICKNGQVVPLKRVAPNEKRDGGVKFIAWNIIKNVVERTGCCPYLLVQQVHRQYINESIRKLYYQKILERASDVHSRFGHCVVLDLHGFSKPGRFEDSDLVLGTMHRETVNPAHNLDRGLAFYLGLIGDYTIYLPNAIAFRGEMYDGTGQGYPTVINYLNQEFKKNGGRGNFIQIEIHGRFRGRDEEERAKGELLSKYFAEALINLFTELKMNAKRS